jgi:hypothetical protein
MEKRDSPLALCLTVEPGTGTIYVMSIAGKLLGQGQ